MGLRATRNLLCVAALTILGGCGAGSGLTSEGSNAKLSRTPPLTTTAPVPSAQPSSPTTSVIPASWPLIPGTAVPAPALYAMSFPSQRLGYAIAGTYQAGDGSISMQLAKSTDGGATWTAEGGLLPDANKRLSAGGNVSPHLAFASASFGYNWDEGEIDVTTDGGAHWQVLSDPPYMSGPYRIGPVVLVGSSLWVSYAGFTPGLSPFGEVASWSPGVGWTSRLNKDIVIHAMTSTSSSVDLLASPTEQPNSTSEMFMRTAAYGNGGWQTPGTLTCPSDSSFVDSMAAVGSTVLAECVGEFGPGWAARSYWLTTNDGATWMMRARDSSEDSLKVGSPPSGEGGALAQGAGGFWVAVTRSTAYGSRDAGLTWSEASGIKTEGAGGAGSVTFNGPDGWCVYFGIGLWRTTDGGATWVELGQSGLPG
jgi:hypothetical protein